MKQRSTMNAISKITTRILGGFRRKLLTKSTEKLENMEYRED